MNKERVIITDRYKMVGPGDPEYPYALAQAISGRIITNSITGEKVTIRAIVRKPTEITPQSKK